MTPIQGSTVNAIRQALPQVATPAAPPENPSSVNTDAVELGSKRPRPSADYATNLSRLTSIKLMDAAQTPPPVPPDFNENPSDRDVNQTGFENELIDDLGDDARVQYHQDVSKLTGAVPTLPQLQAEFDKLAADKSIPFEYIIDGCYARAHLMCDTMAKDNINNAKMFTMLEDPKGPGRLQADNKFMEATWWYHVAPLVFAEDPSSHHVDGYIMDPSMANHPLRAEEWVERMWDDDGTKVKIDITRAPQYGPAESDGVNATFDESMQPAKDTMKEYSDTLAKIKDDYYQHHPNEPHVEAKAA